MIQTIKLGGDKINLETLIWGNRHMTKWKLAGLEARNHSPIEESSNKMTVNLEEEECAWIKKMNALSEGDV